MRRLIVFLFFSFVVGIGLAGCSSPQRHLASDVGLLQTGISTKQDVLVYLGNPDRQKDLGAGVEKWFYRQVDPGLLKKSPLIGRYFAEKKVETAIITFTNGKVSDIAFSLNGKDDLDWSNDYSWQKS
ncbi:MAG: hypothetical protein CSA20_07380 [Deltaproteobacteria bacterium]|nr:MAG: hypothetical protein CSA20_07380 [Deltaproteobacteria bacterium]